MFPSLDPLDSGTRKVFLGVLAALLLLILGLGGYATYQTHIAGACHLQADQATAQARQLAMDLKKSAEREREAQRQVQEATEEVGRLTVALQSAPRPPKALPAPESDPDLTKGLETAGLKVGLVLYRGEGPSTLERHDAVKVWEWNQESLRVPALELRLTAAENLVDGQTKETGALRLEVTEIGTSRDLFKSAKEVETQRADAFQAEAEALHKAAVAAKWKTWAEVCAALAAGYVVGKH